MYQSKEISKKVYNNTIKSIQLYKWILYLGIQKIVKLLNHVLILKLTNKLDLRRGGKIIAISNLSIYYTWKNIKSSHSKTSEPYILILQLSDKLDLRRGEKSIAISNLSVYYTWKNTKSSYNNNKFKI